MSGEHRGRLWLYLVLTFGITWFCWWPLAALVPEGSGVFANPTDTSLYIVGGLGPTIAALLAVSWTRREGTLGDYGRDLVRWRLPAWWYAVGLLFPALLALALDFASAWFGAKHASIPDARELARLPLIFATMIVGGGLEELGWRGVAQPMLEQRLNRLASAAIVGAFWALWHIPLFFIHGVAQFDANYPLFAADVIGNAFLLAWIYGGTRSILICILFHAAGNTSATLGLDAYDASAELAWIGPVVKIVLGALLIIYLPGTVRPEVSGPERA
jgi:membrane protease YdiL (CAAX protease family)